MRKKTNILFLLHFFTITFLHYTIGSKFWKKKKQNTNGFQKFVIILCLLLEFF